MSRQVRVGLLVFAGLALFLVAIFAIANRSFLFSDTFLLHSEFRNVAGLQPGAPVQFQGVRVGRVETVQLPGEPGNPIRVTMAVRTDARDLVHENTQAQIKTEGLVGGQVIVLANPPGPMADRVEPGSTIPGVEPFDVFEITDQALAAVDTFATVAVEAQQIMQDVQRGEGSLGKLIYDPELYNSLVVTANESERTLTELGQDAKAIVALAEESTESVEAILSKINEGEGTVAQLLNEPELYRQMLATSDTLQNIAGDLRAVTTSAEDATNWATLGAFRFSELMEAAKHNFLFKRYFEERGYYEKAPFEMREQALRETYQDLEARLQELHELEERLEAREAELEAQEREASSTSSQGEAPADSTMSSSSSGEDSSNR